MSEDGARIADESEHPFDARGCALVLAIPLQLLGAAMIMKNGGAWLPLPQLLSYVAWGVGVFFGVGLTPPKSSLRVWMYVVIGAFGFAVRLSGLPLRITGFSWVIAALLVSPVMPTIVAIYERRSAG